MPGAVALADEVEDGDEQEATINVRAISPAAAI